jgi:hypothetical protein
MSRLHVCRGIYAVDWAQTQTGDEFALDPGLLVPGLSWRWQGNALRLDGAAPLLWLDRPLERRDPRARARARARRLGPKAAIRAHARDEDAPETRVTTDLPPDSLTLTDGYRMYFARLVRQQGRILAVFDPFLPPEGAELWITGLRLDPTPGAPRRPGVICFLPGTPIETETGWRAVEHLQPGDRLRTRDNGLQPLLWTDETRLTGAELFLYPHLRPVRVRAGALGIDRPAHDILVSPGHRLLVTDPARLFGQDEVLIAAENLIDGRGFRQDFSLDCVRYIHLMMPRHEILNAAGLPCESFHPALADAHLLKRHARTLEPVLPGITRDPENFGPVARRCLEPAEAAVATGWRA